MTIMLIAAVLVACGFAGAYVRVATENRELVAENIELRWQLANQNHPALRRSPWEK